MDRRVCVVCSKKAFRKQMHRFATNIVRRDQWVNALCTTPDEKKRLNDRLDASNPAMICDEHFTDSDYSSPQPNTRILSATAVPFNQRSTVMPATVLPPVAITSPLSTRTFFDSSPLQTPTTSRPRTSFRTAMKEMADDPPWTPPLTSVLHEPEAEYLLVSKESLKDLLRQCPVCIKGRCDLSFKMDGLGFTCTRTCKLCGIRSPWDNSKTLYTANQSSRERLPKINVDVVAGSVITSIGASKLRQVMLMSSISPLSHNVFHRIKKLYVSPAVDIAFEKAQGEVIDSLKARIEKGEKVHLSGDGSYDSRGFSADWCRYFILNAETSEVLHYVLMHKSETTSSSAMEVAALEKGLTELSSMIGGLDCIESLVTDRHSAVTKMLREKFSGIKHFYDPWHFFRNIVLTLLKICKPYYMGKARGWIKTIICRCYDAVISAKGDGDIASQKFRLILFCMQNIHDVSQDPSFTHVKCCQHGPPNAKQKKRVFIPPGGAIFDRLTEQIFTARNIDDIRSVSWLLQTSPCESINALAWRYASKELYFTRPGHEMRTKMTMIHWNHLKHTEADGTRPVKSYVNPTHKTKVWRKVRKAASHPWRQTIKELAYKVRADMSETPYATEKKRKAALMERKRAIEKLTRPEVPAAGDPNLEEEWMSSDEDDEDDGILIPPLSSLEQQYVYVDDANLEQEAEDKEKEAEEEGEEEE